MSLSHEAKKYSRQSAGVLCKALFSLVKEIPADAQA
jgi:hypothetical protein